MRGTTNIANKIMKEFIIYEGYFLIIVLVYLYY